MVIICFIDAEIRFTDAEICIHIDAEFNLVDAKLCFIVVLNIIKYSKATIKSSHDAKQITNIESIQKQIK